ncbi:GntR family transcriptional regulator [Enterococcus songbeiensis]|uniref:GntR family transcriptional regulator n=1 Tax=Enterococcus songbeiensis TaxID=2559927 RepID=UPI0010F9EBC4|nr:GntR family transcriptional regulator [Enterococcus songbeiensis]
MVQVNKAKNIYEDLKRRILMGEFDKYQILPVEKSLEAKYKVSRNTIRKAIRQLNSEGLVYSKLGSANIVLQRVSVKDLLIDSGNMDRSSVIQTDLIETKVLSLEKVKVNDSLASRTMFPAGAICYHVIRLRIINGSPGMIDDSFFLSDIVPNLSKEIAEQSIYRYIQSVPNQKIIGSRLVDRIILATDFDKTHLQLKKENCVGLTQNWSYLDDGKIFEYTEIHFSPEHYVRTRFVAQKI